MLSLSITHKEFCYRDWERMMLRDAKLVCSFIWSPFYCEFLQSKTRPPLCVTKPSGFKAKYTAPKTSRFKTSRFKTSRFNRIRRTSREFGAHFSRIWSSCLARMSILHWNVWILHWNAWICSKIFDLYWKRWIPVQASELACTARAKVAISLKSMNFVLQLMNFDSKMMNLMQTSRFNTGLIQSSSF